MPAGAHARQRSAAIVRLGVLLILAAVTLFPLAWLVSGSLKPLEQVFAIPVQWIPDPIQPQNYPDAVVKTQFLRPLLNSVIVTSAQVAINLVLCSLAGFGFAKYRFPGREQLFLGVLAMTLLPLQVIMIPLFLIVKGLGWINTYQGLIVPTAASAFGVFLMRQFISTIPSDYLDAARVDGASELAVFRKVVLPHLRPALVTLGVLVTLTSWDEFLWPLIIVGARDLQTAPLAMSQLQSQYLTPFNYLLVVAALMVLPPFVAFLFVQREVIETVGHTGIK